MKKFISIFLVVCTVFALAACGGGAADNNPPTTPPPTQQDSATPTPADQTTPPPVETPTEAFPGKIAIVTNTVSQNEEEYRSAQQVVEKYGADKVIHVTWPDKFMDEQEQMVSIIAKIASDSEVKGLIINQAVPGTNPAVDKLLETRKDIFIVYYEPQEDPVDVAARADYILMPSVLEMSEPMVQQAQKMGAKTFVHYSFPRHMSQALLSGRRDRMEKECQRLGIEFVNATAPDPMSDIGMAGAQQAILEDVPKMVAKYGKDTAFFSTNCAMQVPLITAVVDQGAIYPSPCCPSPYHGFPTALGIVKPPAEGEAAEEMMPVDKMIEETKRVAAEKGMTGRLSTWPVPAAMMGTGASAEYIVKVLNGEIPRTPVDQKVLEQCMADYAGTPVQTFVLDNDGVKVDNFFTIIMDYIEY